MNPSRLRIGIGAVLMAFCAQSPAYAEDLEITHCYSGVFSVFNRTEGTSTLGSWAQNGIIMSAHPRKLLHNAVVRCEGIQIGLGAARSLHGFCAGSWTTTET
jgi:hypothetical protein